MAVRVARNNELYTSVGKSSMFRNIPLITWVDLRVGNNSTLIAQQAAEIIWHGSSVAKLASNIF